MQAGVVYSSHSSAHLPQQGVRQPNTWSNVSRGASNTTAPPAPPGTPSLSYVAPPPPTGHTLSYVPSPEASPQVAIGGPSRQAAGSPPRPGMQKNWSMSRLHPQDGPDSIPPMPGVMARLPYQEQREDRHAAPAAPQTVREGPVTSYAAHHTHKAETERGTMQSHSNRAQHCSPPQRGRGGNATSATVGSPKAVGSSTQGSYTPLPGAPAWSLPGPVSAAPADPPRRTYTGNNSEAGTREASTNGHRRSPSARGQHGATESTGPQPRDRRNSMTMERREAELKSELKEAKKKTQELEKLLSKREDQLQRRDETIAKLHEERHNDKEQLKEATRQARRQASEKSNAKDQLCMREGELARKMDELQEREEEIQREENELKVFEQRQEERERDLRMREQHQRERDEQCRKAEEQVRQVRAREATVQQRERELDMEKIALMDERQKLQDSRSSVLTEHEALQEKAKDVQRDREDLHSMRRDLEEREVMLKRQQDAFEQEKNNLHFRFKQLEERENRHIEACKEAQVLRQHPTSARRLSPHGVGKENQNTRKQLEEEMKMQKDRMQEIKQMGWKQEVPQEAGEDQVVC